MRLFLPFFFAALCLTSAGRAAPPADQCLADETRTCLGQPPVGQEPTLPPRKDAKNVDDRPLAACGTAPMTGWFRDGYCRTDVRDCGQHVVCATMTDAFLVDTKKRGNDLITPAPRYNFPGLKAGDRWCLCASRWEEARRQGLAPPVVVDATEASALKVIQKKNLKAHARQARKP